MTVAPILRARALPFGAAMLLALGSTGAPCETSPYYIGASQNVAHESNLLRIGDADPVPAGYSRSDTISATSLLAGIDQPIGRQRVFGNVSLRSTKYRDNSAFDNRGYSASAGLDWETINRISGTVRASGNRTLASFGLTEIGVLSEKNLETSQSLNATLSVGMVTQYSFEGAIGHRRVRNSLQQANVQSRNFDQDMISAGMRWRPSGASNFGIAVRDTKGRYPNFVLRATGDGYDADRFTEHSLDLTAQFLPSGASSVDGRLSYARTKYDINDQRNFSGFTGALGWVWQATGKVKLDTRLARDTGQNSYAVAVFNTPGLADYSQTTSTLRIQADYAVSAKVGLNAALQASHRKLVRTVENPFIPLNASGRERDTLLSVGARWTPLRNALVGCDIGTEHRDASGSLSTDLSNRSFSCYGQLTLQ